MSTDEVIENDQRIKELTESPPAAAVGRSRRARYLDRVRNVAALVAFIALGLGLWTMGQQNQQTREATVTACVEGNRVRVQVKTLWQYIIDESRKANPNPTAKQAQALRAFEAKVDDIYVPRVC